MGFPSPGVFSLRARERHAAEVGVPHGRRSTRSLRLPQGRGPDRPQEPRGQDHPARLRRLAVDRRSDASACRASTSRKVKYVEAGWPTWGTALARRPGRRRPRRGKACAPSGSARASTSTTGSACRTRRSSPTPTWSVPPTSRIPTRRPSSTSISAAGRWASSSPTTTRWPRRMRCSSSSRRSRPTSGRSSARMSILQQHNVVPRRHVQARRAGATTTWRPGRPSSTRSTSSARSPSRSRPRTSAPTTCIAAANDFDHDKVKADAAAYEAARRARGDRCRRRHGAPVRPGRAA